MDKVRSEMQRRTGVTRDGWLSRAVLRYFGYMERMEERIIASYVRGGKLRKRL